MTTYIYQFATCRTRSILSRIVKKARVDRIQLDWCIDDCMDKSYPFLMETESSITQQLNSINEDKQTILLIEISTIKYSKDIKFNREQFVHFIENIIDTTSKANHVIWVSSHNIQLSKKHYEMISAGAGIRDVDQVKKVFTGDRRFIQRIDCENWLEQIVEKHNNHIFIKTSDCFKDLDSESVFQCVENTPQMPKDKAANTVDTYHYHRDIEPVLLDFVYDKINHIL